MGLASFDSTCLIPDMHHLLIFQVLFFEILSPLKRALLYTVFEGED